MHRLITFTDLYGKQLSISSDRVAFRPSVYGLIVHDQRLLLCNTKSTGKWSLPGGGIDIGETAVEALTREIQEECGIEASIEDCAGFQESFFYYNPKDMAVQVLALFFHGTPKTLELSLKDLNELEAEKPQWVAISDLHPEDFQAFGEFALSKLRTCA